MLRDYQPSRWSATDGTAKNAVLSFQCTGGEAGMTGGQCGLLEQVRNALAGFQRSSDQTAVSMTAGISMKLALGDDDGDNGRREYDLTSMFRQYMV